MHEEYVVRRECTMHERTKKSRSFDPVLQEYSRFTRTICSCRTGSARRVSDQISDYVARVARAQAEGLALGAGLFAQSRQLGAEGLL